MINKPNLCRTVNVLTSVYNYFTMYSLCQPLPICVEFEKMICYDKKS